MPVCMRRWLATRIRRKGGPNPPLGPDSHHSPRMDVLGVTVDGELARRHLDEEWFGVTVDGEPSQLESSIHKVKRDSEQDWRQASSPGCTTGKKR